jgi:hypothetical protein
LDQTLTQGVQQCTHIRVVDSWLTHLWSCNEAQEAVKNTEYWRLIDPEGKPPGFLGWWPSKAVTFVDNHDTGWVARGLPLS